MNTSQQNNYTFKDINRHWLIWIKKESLIEDYIEENYPCIQKHIDINLPFICARFSPQEPDTLNLGFCIPADSNRKPYRKSIRTNKKFIDRFRPPLLLSEAIQKLPRKYSCKLQNLHNTLINAELNEAHIFGSFLWESLTEKQHIRPESDLDLVIEINTIEEMCLYIDILEKWGKKSGIKADCEFCIDNKIYFSSKEFFTQSKSLLIKTKNSIDLIDKNKLLDDLTFNQSNSISFHFSKTKNYLSKNQLAEKLAFHACRALYSELNVFPKPGLVSFYDSGSHTDMDYNTFLKSIKTLFIYFNKVGFAVIEGCAYPTLVKIGKNAENKMLAATNGINTHKGAIFSLGLLTAAAMKSILDNKKLSTTSIQKTLINNWADNISNHSVPGSTHGRQVAVNHKVHGILQEAAAGYPIIFNIALPCLKETMQKTSNFNQSLLQTFFVIMSKLDDTNVLYRGGKAASKLVKQEADLFLKSRGIYNKNWLCNAKKTHELFIKERLSPGGCADILACTIFIYNITEN